MTDAPPDPSGAASADLLRDVGSSPEGLTDAEAASRLQRVGPNLIAREHPQSVGRALLGRARNPLNFLLLGLAAVSWATDDVRAAIVIVAMVILSVTLAFVQEHRSNKAVAALRAMVHTPGAVERSRKCRQTPWSRATSCDCRRAMGSTTGRR